MALNGSEPNRWEESPNRDTTDRKGPLPNMGTIIPQCIAQRDLLAVMLQLTLNQETELVPQFPILPRQRNPFFDRNIEIVVARILDTLAQLIELEDLVLFLLGQCGEIGVEDIVLQSIETLSGQLELVLPNCHQILRSSDVTL